ncbi:DUF4340 domain-containing protein [Tundrisphaera sp. TA3]|uniref:DUF4340 domain-containing protein n=1 Tax=Tundrisphaera sp. TA3 TaxID=3435775 RepID=UPI003EBD1C33
MNREMSKTLVFVAVAVVMIGAAYFTHADRSVTSSAFDDQGQKFFPEFTDPNACTTLEVVDYDPATADILPFKVTLKNGKWTIPSHYDYPADAKQRLVDTASGVLDLHKDSIRSDRTEDHADFGVIDPLDTKATASLKGIGKKVTLRDASDNVLAEFIIGQPVKDHPEQRYVRVPGQKRTYGVNVKVDLSTRFADWIETNLLKLDASKVHRVVIDHKKFDPDTGRLIPGEVVTLTRKDASSPWALEGMPEGKETNTETLSALTTALADLKIAGIRPKPEGLTGDLKEAPGEVKPTTRQALLSLVAKGFYPTKQGLLSNQGEVTVSTDEGVVYTLRYGEAFFGAGNELSSGETKSAEAEKGKDATKDKPPGATEGRYLFATAAFDPSLIPPPKPPTGDAAFPDDPFHYDEGDSKILVESQAEKDRVAALQAEQDKVIADGQKKAKELSDRFAPWYYVTPNEGFRAIVLDSASLIRDKGSKPAGPAGGMGLPGGLGLPEGLNFPGGMGGGRPINPH